jgi:hypothetical protein
MQVILDANDTAKKQFSISYLDKNEATFVLGLLKNVPCSHCPDFYKDCKSELTLQETAMMSEYEYINKHFAGTEGHLCGKLRNIVCLSKAEEQELSNKFEEKFNTRISLLTKKNDSDKYVLIHDKDEYVSIMKSFEQQIVGKLQKDFENVNQHNIEVMKEMQTKMQEMQKTIIKLKNRKTKNVD